MRNFLNLLKPEPQKDPEPASLLQQKRTKVLSLEEQTARALETKKQRERELADALEPPYEIELPDRRYSGAVGISFITGTLPADPTVAKQRAMSAHSDWAELCRERDQARAELNSYERLLRSLRDDLRSLAELE